MLKAYARTFAELAATLDDISWSLDNLARVHGNRPLAPEPLNRLCYWLDIARSCCIELGLTRILPEIDRILTVRDADVVLAPGPVSEVRHLLQRIQDDLADSYFLYVLDAEFYNRPFEKWQGVADRFSRTTTEIEEAGKCFALGRYGACVYYLMRVVEVPLLEMAKLIDLEDPKPSWGSILQKIDKILRKTPYPDRSPKLQNATSFLEAILPHMYAVKDAWRNKVDHVDTRILPSDTQFTREIALDIYNASAALMRKLAMEMPNAGEGQ